jgi:hypothetical protein
MCTKGEGSETPDYPSYPASDRKIVGQKDPRIGTYGAIPAKFLGSENR